MLPVYLCGTLYTPSRCNSKDNCKVNQLLLLAKNLIVGFFFIGSSIYEQDVVGIFFVLVKTRTFKCFVPVVCSKDALIFSSFTELFQHKSTFFFVVCTIM